MATMLIPLTAGLSKLKTTSPGLASGSVSQEGTLCPRWPFRGAHKVPSEKTCRKFSDWNAHQKLVAGLTGTVMGLSFLELVMLHSYRKT